MNTSKLHMYNERSARPSTIYAWKYEKCHVVEDDLMQISAFNQQLVDTKLRKYHENHKFHGFNA